MSDSNIFGRIIDADDVERGVVSLLEAWIDDYLGEMERLKGYAAGEIERPHGIVTGSDFSKWPEDQVPVILVIAGDVPKVRKHEQGKHEATWSIGVAPIVSDVDQPSTRRLAFTYAAAVRAAIVQHKAMKSAAYPQGLSSATDWVGESYADIAFDQTRTLGAARVIFNVTVEDVVQAHAGPRVPSGAPSVDPGGWPVIQWPIPVTVDPRPLSEAIS